MSRTRVTLLVVLSLLLFASSCSDKTTTEPAPLSNDNFVISSVSREKAPQVSDADLAAAVAGEADFTLKAFPLLESNPDKNVVFSPYSITLAVALAATGAQGTTLSEIETAMSFTLPQELLNPAFNKLDLLLASKATGTVHEDGSLSPQLNIVNAVWAQSGYSLLPAYLDSIALNYGAGLHLVDYINATEASRQTINAWVNDQTNSRIPELMEQGSVTDSTRVVLTNAIWFKANWSSKFPVVRTASRNFYNRDTTPAVVSFMSQTFNVPAVSNSECQAVDIPYLDNNLSMLVVMPTGTFDSFLAGLNPAKLSSIIGQLSDQEVALSLPKFTFNTAAGLNSVLKSLGMSAAFDPTNADFSGITGNYDLSIQEVVHKAFISVDENGTEAAAATGLSMGNTSVPPTPAIINIDHPFIFAIRDRQTGTILFLGKVVTL